MTPAQFIDDPDWANFIPEMRDAAKTRHLPTHEDCAQLDVESAAMHLRAGGTLGAMRGYEERPGQIDMLSAIVRAFNGREHLMVEAGTGVGKSLAYLLPAVHWSWTNDTPTVISTATRNLQSQLILSDIPRAVATLGDAAADYRVALLKGRANYLCLRAVAEFFAPGYWTMSADEKAEMPHFIDWLRTTEDGDLDRYEGLPRALLTCPGEECGGRRCPYYSRCFVYRARRAASAAHLVVVNHALVMADAANPGGGILPAYGRLVLDEAHNLEDIATEYLENEFSLPALARILNRLLRRRGHGGRAAGVLASVERQLKGGVLRGSVGAPQVTRLLAEMTRLIGKVERAASALADVVGLMLRPAGERGLCRYRTRADADGLPIREHSLHGLFKPFLREEWDESALAAAEAGLEAALAALVNRLHDLRDALDDAVPEGEFNYLGDLSSQANGIAEALVDFSNATHFVLQGEKETHAYWVERVAYERRHPPYVRLVAAPLTVADDLKRMLYNVKDSVVLCSATLRVGNDFRYMARRLGCGILDVRGAEESPGKFRALTAASPFDYLRQALVLAPDCLPDPSADAAKYASALAALLRDLFTVTDGRALVLFTSYEMMNAVAAHARADLAAAGLKLLVQGEGMSREAMTAALKSADGGTAVFGAQSFWEGVDVSGEALSCVVLARLPFAQMGDPVVEARGERIDREGGSSFRDYSLPEAVIKFRQGFGRLIRSKGDRGVVVITDPRLVTKNYGATFRRSIPATVHTVTSADDLLDRVRDFFAVDPGA